MIKDSEILQDNSDDHVFIVVRCPDRPTISIDITNEHGRRCIGIRVDGMGIFSALLDLKELGPMCGDELFRYCGMCGEKLQLHSSRGHTCPPKNDKVSKDPDSAGGQRIVASSGDLPADTAPVSGGGQ